MQRPHVPLGGSRSAPRRRPGAVLLAGTLIVLLAGPANGQEVPEPTPTPSPSASPAPSPTPAPSPSAAAVQPSTTIQPDRSARRGTRRRQRKPRRKARWEAEPLRAKRGCQPFTFTQAYLTWGPALAYGEPVTVAYDASQCTRPSGTAVELSMQGTAKVYRGTVAEGTPIDTRPFTVTGLWDRPKDPSGWPLTWWSCGVKLARYTWEIAGVYTFGVSARWGVWSLEITTLGAAPSTFRWTHNACS